MLYALARVHIISNPINKTIHYNCSFVG